MFKITHCNPTGLFSYGHHRTIELDGQGLVLLEGINHDRHGGSNGAGKSSLMHAIVHVLYGKNPSKETGDSVSNSSLGRYFGMVQVTDRNGDVWRIIDIRKWKKNEKPPFDPGPSQILASGLKYSGTDLYLEKLVDGIWQDARATNKQAGDFKLDMKATRAKVINEVLGVSYDQFMSIAYLAQSKTLKFMEGTHKERMEVLAELGDLKAWDERSKRLKSDIGLVEGEISKLEHNLAGMSSVGLKPPDIAGLVNAAQQAEAVRGSISAIDEDIARLSKELDLWLRGQADHQAQVSDLVQQIKKFQLDKDRIRNEYDLIMQVYTNDCNAIRLRQKPHEISALEIESNELAGTRNARFADLEQLSSTPGRCPKCKSNVSAEHLARQRELMVVELEEIQTKIFDIKAKIDDGIKAFEAETLQLIADRTHQLGIQRSIIDQMVAAADAAVNTATEKLSELKRLDLGQDPRHVISAKERERYNLLIQQQQINSYVDNINTAVTQYNEYMALTERARLQIQEHKFKLKHLYTLERLFGDKGIRAFKLENIVSNLNIAIRKYLDILTGSTVQVILSTSRTKVDGDVTTDIQISVQEGSKVDVPITLYSGGEKQQITLALIGAFWEVAVNSGAGTNVMFLDEIFGPLDEINSSSVFQFLDLIKRSGKNTMIVVTHTDIKNLVTFDKVWTVVKSNHTSKLET